MTICVQNYFNIQLVMARFKLKFIVKSSYKMLNTLNNYN